MNPTDEQAKLPIIAAYFYEHITSQNPALAEFMSREEYIDSFLRWQGQPILVTTSGGNC